MTRCRFTDQRGRPRRSEPDGRGLWAAALGLVLSFGMIAGCGGTTGEDGPAVDALPYARTVIAFMPGEGAGYGQGNLPDVVTGPPGSEGTGSGSTSVLSLGDGGVIELGFGPRRIENGPGADFIVYENPFYVGGDESEPYQELARVEVSQMGETWHSFECIESGTGAGEYPGCAGWRPVKSFDPFDIVPPSPAATGGDPFDLSDVGLESASYVRIVGISDRGPTDSGKVGFDLDAVGIVHPIEDR